MRFRSTGCPFETAKIILFHLNKGSRYVALATGLQMNHFVDDKITDSSAKYSPEYLTSTTRSECTRIFIVVSLPLRCFMLLLISEHSKNSL